MASFCPRCGVFADDVPLKVGRYSVKCGSCNGEFMENEYRTDADLAGPKELPAGSRIEFTFDGAGNGTFLIPSVGFTGVHYAPVIFAVLWTFTSACAIAAACAFGFLFILPAAFLCIPTISVAVGAVNSLKETQEIALSKDGLCVTKHGLLLRTSRFIPLADVEVISVRRTPPLNPLDPGRFLLHISDVADLDGMIPVPAVTHKHKQTRFGEFLSDAEKRWLVWTLKSAVLRVSGKVV